jgi:CheY-like chemotaxis protein
VRDTGIGIAPDMLPRVFELFVQERQAIDRSQGGLGLGLAIVRTLIALHGGTVEARSDGPGHGAEFIVRLPRAGTELVVSRQPEGAGRGPLDRPAHVRRVLIVDDNEDAAAMLAEALATYGHVIATAADGPAALTAAAEFQPDVALLDIGLPVMDGYELARRMREHPALQRVRLVAVTGYGQEQDRQRSSAAGFAAHLVKPVDIDAVRVLLDA